VIWVGSGENNNQRSVAYGDGVYKSEDGGKSFKNMGLTKSEHIGMIAIDPNNFQNSVRSRLRSGLECRRREGHLQNNRWRQNLETSAERERTHRF
jgi:hypothetical protein